MRAIILLLLCTALYQATSAQKLETIKFNLYTDSLKKGFYNFINVDGQFSDGRWLPMTNHEINLTVHAPQGAEKHIFFEGNSLFIDSAYSSDSVVVRAVLRSNPAIWQERTIYIRKRGFDEPLKTNEEILNEPKPGRKKPKQRLS